MHNTFWNKVVVVLVRPNSTVAITLALCSLFIAPVLAAGQGVETDIASFFESDSLPPDGSQRVDALLKDLGDWGSHQGDLWPGIGSEITSVTPGSPAEQGNVRVGDVLMAIEGRRLLTGDDLAAAREEARPGKTMVFSFLRPGVKRFEVRAELDSLGVNVRGQRWDYRSYLALCPRDVGWDRWVVAAAEALKQRQPSLAAAALRRAFQAGCGTNEFIDTLAFRVLMEQGRWYQAGKIFERAQPFGTQSPWGPAVLDRYLAARAAGRWGDMMAVLRQNETGVSDADLPEHEQWFTQHRLERIPARPLPSQIADESLDREIVNKNMVAVNGTILQLNNTYETLIDHVIDGKSFDTSPLPGNYTAAVVRTLKPLQDFEIATSFKFRSSGEPHHTWINSMDVSILDLSSSEDWDDILEDVLRGPNTLLNAGLIREKNESVISLHSRSHRISGFYKRNTPWVAEDGETVHTMRLIRVDGIGQVIIDGRTVLLAPLDPEVQLLAIKLHIVGFHVEFEKFHVIALGRD